MLTGFFNGNLGGDAEVRKHEGREFLSFSVAVRNRRAKNEEDRTVWVRCTYNAVKAAEYLKKGKGVVCTGQLVVSSYEGKPQIDCYCDSVELTDKKE